MTAMVRVPELRPYRATEASTEVAALPQGKDRGGWADQMWAQTWRAAERSLPAPGRQAPSAAETLALIFPEAKLRAHPALIQALFDWLDSHPLAEAFELIARAETRPKDAAPWLMAEVWRLGRTLQLRNPSGSFRRDPGEPGNPQASELALRAMLHARRNRLLNAHLTIPYDAPPTGWDRFVDALQVGWDALTPDDPTTPNVFGDRALSTARTLMPEVGGEGLGNRLDRYIEETEGYLSRQPREKFEDPVGEALLHLTDLLAAPEALPEPLAWAHTHLDPKTVASQIRPTPTTRGTSAPTAGRKDELLLALLALLALPHQAHAAPGGLRARLSAAFQRDEGQDKVAVTALAAHLLAMQRQDGSMLGNRRITLLLTIALDRAQDFGLPPSMAALAVAARDDALRYLIRTQPEAERVLSTYEAQARQVSAGGAVGPRNNHLGAHLETTRALPELTAAMADFKTATVVSQVDLRDARGEPIKSPLDGHGRRIDLVAFVRHHGQWVPKRSVEVTHGAVTGKSGADAGMSDEAWIAGARGIGNDKTAQFAKEKAIRRRRKVFVRGPEGVLVPFPPELRTELWRYSI